MTEPSKAIGESPWRRHFGFLAYTAKRFLGDQCTVRAAGLTYTSLLALVPLLAISFAIFSAFPAFDDMQVIVQGYIFENFVPQVGETVLQYLDGFTKQTGKLTAVGIVFLVATSVMLLLSITNVFDAIWRSAGERTLIGRLLVYWAVLTLSPLLLGASISISGYLFTAARASGVEQLTGPLSNFTVLLPLLFQFGGFTVLYIVMPNAPVRVRDALIGGFTAALLFEILKKLFGLYITTFPTYETIYGALATIPIFLIWIYISWLLVLFGAELTAAIPEWRRGERDASANDAQDGTARVGTALSLLFCLSIAARKGTALSSTQLAGQARQSAALANGVLRQLEARNYVVHNRRNEWLLTRDLDAVSLHELAKDIGIAATLPNRFSGTLAWEQRYSRIVAELNAESERFMSMPVKSLLTNDGADDLAEIENADIDDTPPATARKARILAWIGLGWLGSS